MARIAGVDIPREKRLDISLSYIYGIGRKTALTICEATNLPGQTRVRDLSEEEVAKLRQFIDANIKVEVTFDAMFHKTLNERWKSAVMSVSVTVVVSLFVDSAHLLTRAREKVQRRPWPVRRR